MGDILSTLLSALQEPH